MGKILLHEESEATVSDSFLKDTRANAQGRIIGLIWRKGLGTSREDISGNGRRACEPEFNYKGCEQSRSEMERWTGTPEGTWNVLRMFRETHAISAIASSTTNRIRGRTLGHNSQCELWVTGLIWRKGLGTSRAKSFTVRRIWVVGIANDIEWLIYKTIQYKLFAVINLTRKSINHCA